MNPVYTVLESPHRWALLAGLSFAVGFVGAMAILAYGWAHALARFWFLLGLALTLYFLARAFWQWKVDTDAELAENERRQTTAGTERLVDS